MAPTPLPVPPGCFPTPAPPPGDPPAKNCPEVGEEPSRGQGQVSGGAGSEAGPAEPDPEPPASPKDAPMVDEEPLPKRRRFTKWGQGILDSGAASSQVTTWVSGEPGPKFGS